jgi:hypothetical protein
MSNTTNYRMLVYIHDGGSPLDLDVVVSETDVTYRVWTPRPSEVFSEITAEGSAREVFLHLVDRARHLEDTGLGF